MKYVNYYLNQLCCIIVSIFIFSCDNNKIEHSEAINSKDQIINSDCVEYIALWSASDISELTGKDKKWIFLNYTVDLWDRPPSNGKGVIIGKLKASSYAQIFEKTDNDYKVKSPLDGVLGWVNNEHVKAISWKNPKTNKLCGKSLIPPNE